MGRKQYKKAWFYHSVIVIVTSASMLACTAAVNDFCLFVLRVLALLFLGGLHLRVQRLMISRYAWNGSNLVQQQQLLAVQPAPGAAHGDSIAIVGVGRGRATCRPTITSNCLLS